MKNMPNAAEEGGAERVGGVDGDGFHGLYRSLRMFSASLEEHWGTVYLLPRKAGPFAS